MRIIPSSTSIFCRKKLSQHSLLLPNPLRKGDELVKQWKLLIFLLMFLAACNGLVQPSASDPPSSTPSSANPADAAYLPNPKLTPGDALAVTKNDICEPGYSSKVRDVPDSVKNQVYQEYGITSHRPGEYEVDHLISLELGGSNSIKNLWPQSYSGNWNAHMKDKLENKLHQLVCDGSLDLKTAQGEISGDWITAYQKYLSK